MNFNILPTAYSTVKIHTDMTNLKTVI